MSEYETVLQQIRPFGPFQVRIFVLVSLFETPLAWAMLVPIFTASNPGFLCASVDETTKQRTYSSNINHTNSCGGNRSSCNLSFRTEFTSIVSEWSLICEEKYIGELITSLQMAGVMVGAVITGQMGDIFGRKKMLFIEYFLLVVVWFCTALAPSWQVYAALRFVVGGLIGGCLVVNFVLPLEFVTPSWRTFCGCIGFWAFGIMTLAPWAYFIRDWRTLNMAMSSTSIVLLALWWFVEESPRWLMSKGYMKEAEEIIRRAAKFNNRPIPDLTPLQDFAKRSKIEREDRKKYTYWHLCSSFQLGKGTLICMFGWFVASSSYYGLNFNSKNLAGNRYLNVFISGFVEIPALIFVLLANNRLGRRKTTFTLLFIAGVSCFSILFLDISGKIETWSALTITMAMIGKSCIAGGWAAVQILSAETFPTVIRNIGIGSCSMAARIGGILAPQLVLLGETSKPIPFTVFGVCSILCSLLILCLKETVDSPLQDRLIREDTSVTSNLQCEALVENPRAVKLETGQLEMEIHGTVRPHENGYSKVPHSVLELEQR